MFQRLVTAMIVVNFPVAAWAELTRDELAERVDAAIIVFFVGEVGVRLVFAVKRREWDAWLAVDAMIVALAALPFGAIPVVRAARLAHLGRHVEHLRHATVARLVHA